MKKWIGGIVGIIVLISIIAYGWINWPINEKKNESPIAKITRVPHALGNDAEENTIFENEEYEYSGIGNDSDGKIVLYEWDFDGDGIFDYSSNTSGNVTYTYTERGHFTITFRVTDNMGDSGTDTAEINVLGKNAPSPFLSLVLNIDEPTYYETESGDFFVNITGNATSLDSRINIISIEIQVDDGNWTPTNYTFHGINVTPQYTWFYFLNYSKLSDALDGKHIATVRIIDNIYCGEEWIKESIGI